MKSSIIKKAMKLREKTPSSDDFYTNLIFHHSSFTEASKQEREGIMLKSSLLRYEGEFQHTFDSYFGLDLAPLLMNQVALDLGCFTGGRSVAWFERYKLDKIYGIDVKGVYIEAAQRFAEVKGANAEFTCSEGESLPFEDETFDAILSYDVFEHVRDVKAVLLQCNRVLKEGGKLFVVFPSYFHPTGHHLTSVTVTPFIHYFFSGRDLVDVYNEIIDERGVEANWYKRQKLNLEAWERCNTINGMTKWKFRHLINHTGWSIYYEYSLPLLRPGGIIERHPLLKLIRYAVTPLAKLRGFEEFLCGRIVYILQKSYKTRRN